MPVPDRVPDMHSGTVLGVGIFVRSGSRLTRCQTVRHSSIKKRYKYTLYVHIAGGERGYTLHIHTAGGEKGYTLHVYTGWRWKGMHPAPIYFWQLNGIHPACPFCWQLIGIFLHVHTAGLERGDTLHAHIAGGGKGDTLAIWASILLAVERDTPYTSNWRQREKIHPAHPYKAADGVILAIGCWKIICNAGMPEKVCATSAFLPVVSSFSPALTFRHQGSVR
jgi:hypothetical protein